MYELEKFALGWLLWSPEQLDKTHLARVVTAREGRQDMIIKILEMVFGSTEKPKRTASPQSITPRMFDVLFGQGTPPDRRKLN